MKPRQTHTERDELNILNTWMQGYRMVNKAVQCGVIFRVSFKFDQWEQDWQGMENTLLEVSIAQVEVHRTWLWMRVSGQRERSAVERTQRLLSTQWSFVWLWEGMSATGVDQSTESTEKAQAPGSSSPVTQHLHDGVRYSGFFQSCAMSYATSPKTLSASFGIVGPKTSRAFLP